MSGSIDFIRSGDVNYKEYCVVLADGTLIYRYVPDCDECPDEQDYFTNELGDKIPTPDLTGATRCKTPEKEVVCVDLGDGCNIPAFRLVDENSETFITEDGDVTSQVVKWKAGSCGQNRAFIDTCFLPDQYAIQWSWAGNGDVTSFDAITGITTYWGKTQIGGTTIGGFALAFKNDTIEPTLFFQRAGALYKASPDDPIGTFALVGSNSLPSFPCFDFDPSGRLLAGDGNTAYEINPDTGATTSLGNLIDVRDNANLSVSPGDWFFDPNGQWFMMARDNRGASFTDALGVAYCTGTALWKIDTSTLEATRVNNSCSVVSGTGASWLASGQYLLSTSTGAVYVHNTYTETWEVFYNADSSGTNVTINDLAAQWIIPDPIRVFGWVDEDCGNSPVCNPKLFTLEQDPDTFAFSCVEFIPTLTGQLGICEKQPNPFVSDPFTESSGGSDSKNPDQVWNNGCSDAGVTLYRTSCDTAGNEFTEYIYGALTESTTLKPSNFSQIACEDQPELNCETTQWCNEDNAPIKSVFRKECTDGSITWYDETGTIAEPVNKTIGQCDPVDPLLPVTEQVVCFEGVTYVRVKKEQYTPNIDGLPELTNYQILYYNESGTLYDSGVLLPSETPLNEPSGWYLGDCVADFTPTIQDEERMEICSGTDTYWRVVTTDETGFKTVTFENETGEVPEPTGWTIGRCVDPPLEIQTRIHENFVVTGTTPLVIPEGAISISVTKTSNKGQVLVSGDNSIDFPLDFKTENFTDSINEGYSILTEYTITGTDADTTYKVHIIR